MELLSRFAQFRISSKLLLFNIITTVLLGLVMGLALISYRHVQVLLSETVDQGLEQLNRNGRISRELSLVFADTNLLLTTFYHNTQVVGQRGEFLLRQFDTIREMTSNDRLNQALDQLTEDLGKVIFHCQIVIDTLAEFDSEYGRIWELLGRVDENIAGKLIDAVLEGENSTILEQMATLLGGLREEMMDIGKTHAELWPEQYGRKEAAAGLPVIGKIDDLLIRLHSMTAADREIETMVKALIGELGEYRQLVFLLDGEMRKFWGQKQKFENSKGEILSIIDQMEGDVVLISQQVSDNIAAKSRLVGILGLVLGLGMIILIGVATTLFFRRILRQPMQRITDGVQRFSSGDLKYRIELGRKDEWSAIEHSLNTMAGQLAATYAALEQKISELELSMTACEVAEKAVRSSEEKYRSIFENAVEGLFQVTLDGNVLVANPAFAGILGYESAGEVVDKVTDIKRQHYYIPEDWDRLVELLLREGVTTGFETRFRRVDGTVIWGAVNATYRQRTESGAPRIDGILQDITARKKIEQEREALEGQLRQSQKMEAMGSLAGGIAHDFNNLLHAISGYLELLMLRKKSTDTDYKFLSEIRRACDRATEIAQRLLTFSRKIETRRIPVDMNAVIEGALKIISVSLPKMIAIETHLSDDIRLVNTDPTQMEQVFLNLANNAADAMPTGGRLVFETELMVLDSQFQSKHLEIEAGEYVVVTVTDTGAGMDRDTLSHIFEPFYTTKEIGKGTGLGLAIVYGIIKSFKGHITCYSEPGNGTTFKIYMPTATREDVQDSADGLVYDSVSVRGSETVLVVDDEKMICDLAEEMLTSFGYTVLQAESGEKALELYGKKMEEIDLVILDLGMPGIGGEQSLAELIKIDPQVKVIVASGYGAHRVVRKPLEYGAISSIRKPYQFEEMMMSIRTAFDVPPHELSV